MTRNFNPGDRVRIRSWKSMADEFGTTSWGAINLPGAYFVDGMRKYCGGIFIVNEVDGKRIGLINEDDGSEVTREYCFTRDMLAHAPEGDYKVVITVEGPVTTAKLYNGKWCEASAKATCSPDDSFCFETGAMLAMERLFPDAPTIIPKPEPKRKPWFGHVVALGDSVQLPSMSSIWTRGKIYAVEDGLIDTDIPGTVRGKGSHDLPYENFAELNRLFPHQFIEIKGGLPQC